MSESPINFRAEPGKRACPVCAADSKGCSATEDGLHFCRGDLAWAADWFEVRPQLPDDCGFRHFRRAKEKPAAAGGGAGTPTDFVKVAAQRAADMAASPHHLAALAADLMLPAAALLPFGVGLKIFASGDRQYTVAERNGAGTIIGLATRTYSDGRPPEKKCVRGSKRGLTLPAGYRDRPGPLFCVEGFTDAAAMTAAGLCAVGRPNNAGGARNLAALLRDWPDDRVVVVVGENDRKPGGEWPGRDGADAVARRLRGSLGCAVTTALPPAGVKDVREWLTHPDRGDAPWADRGAELAALLAPSGEGPEGPGACGPTPDPADCRGVDVLDPQRLAETFLLSRGYRVEGDSIDYRLVYHNQRFYAWSAGAYRELADADVGSEMTRHANAEVCRDHQEKKEAHGRAVREGDGEKSPKFPERAWVTCATVANAMNCVRSEVWISADVVAPCWLTARGDRPDPATLVPTEAAIIDPVGGEILGVTPELFVLSASPHYRPGEVEPTKTLAYLNWLFEGEPERVGALLEFYGLCLISSLKFQKAALVVGPSGTGKSDIVAALLQQLVGPRNFGGTSFEKLGGRFGLASIDGKAAAVIDELRTDCRSSQDRIAISYLMSVISGGLNPVEKKGKDSVETRVSARLLMLSNEMPKLRDDSPDAIVRRLLVLPTGRPLPDKKRDTRLIDKLLPELPGLFDLALLGLRRLLLRGRFVQPRAGSEALGGLREESSDVASFAAEWVVIDDDAATPTADLYAAWRNWCDANAVKSEDRVGTRRHFMARLVKLFPDAVRSRESSGASRGYSYRGVRIVQPDESVPSPSHCRPNENGANGTGLNPQNDGTCGDPSHCPIDSSTSSHGREEGDAPHDTSHAYRVGDSNGAPMGHRDGDDGDTAASVDHVGTYAAAAGRPVVVGNGTTGGGTAESRHGEAPAPHARTRRRSRPDDRPAAARPPRPASGGAA